MKLKPAVASSSAGAADGKSAVEVGNIELQPRVTDARNNAHAENDALRCAGKEAYRASRAAAENHSAGRHEADDDGLCEHDAGGMKRPLKKTA